MYEQNFQLKQRPFPAAASVEHWCQVASTSLALEQLAAAIQRGPGISLLVGATGTGKTLVLEQLARQAAARGQDHVQITCSRLDGRRDLLQRILFELNLPCRDQNESDLRLLAVQHLRGICGQQGRSVLLLVDEAHSLAVELLDELRVLAETAARNTGRCHLVLAGTARLEERLAHSDLDAFNQRIVCRAFLETLGRDETANYVQQHLRRAGGGNRKLFQAEALTRIWELTRGVPRLVNQLCDQALVSCAASGSRSVSGELVEAAWCDLQNLPRSAATSAGPASGHAVTATIEFGSLEDGPTGAMAGDAASELSALEHALPDYRPELEDTPLAGDFFSAEQIAPAEAVPSRRKSRPGQKTRSRPAQQPATDSASRAVKTPASEPVVLTTAEPAATPAISPFPAFEPAGLTDPAIYAVDGLITPAEGRRPPAMQVIRREEPLLPTTGDDRELLLATEVTRYEPTPSEPQIHQPAEISPAASAPRGPHRPRAIRLDYHQLFAQLRENEN